MSTRRWSMTLVVPVFALAALGPWASDAAAAGVVKRPVRETLTFSSLQSLSPDEARVRCLESLGDAGSDPTVLRAFEAVWADPSKSLTDRVADSLVLADPAATLLLMEARDPRVPPPAAVPGLLLDAKRPVFFRANVAVAYSAGLLAKRDYEDALESVRWIKPEQVADPGAYLFQRSVAEHALLLKDDASRSIMRLLDDVADAPERYKQLALLMQLDLLTWKQKDFGEIGRKMNNIERRLDLLRGGPKTQKLQKEVLLRLDELIKQLENQANGSSQGNGGACPSGGQKDGQGSNKPASPMKDSQIATNGGPGNVDQKKLESLARGWGKLPEKERAAAMESIKRDLPAQYREAIEVYFKKMAQGTSQK